MKKKTTKPDGICRAWEAFLPIAGALKSDQAPEADVLWLAQRGIEVGALTTLRAVRRELLPLVTRLDNCVEQCCFLVHDRSSGVPCPPEDHSEYLHLRLWFLRAWSPSQVRKILPAQWLYPRPIEGLEKTSTFYQFESVLEPTLNYKGQAHLAWQLLCAQSELYLQLVENCRESASDFEVLRHVRQHLHYFANMAQTRIA